MAEEAPAAKKSDLRVRTVSAVVMLAVAGTALWLGGWVFKAFVIAVGLGVLWEWWGLVQRIAPGKAVRLIWMIGGTVYIGGAMHSLLPISKIIWSDNALPLVVCLPLLLVIATDIGAYFAGRMIGGPKIAPSISPSKTWAGLGGGVLCASIVVALVASHYLGQGLADEMAYLRSLAFIGLSLGVPLAILAQAGDFFESWMKRRAGVKDSGSLIPGHGGLFDRVDGLLPVAIATPYILSLVTRGLA
jgi:phosphatidate cytidylyltransferase